ncbi:hypothetical protein ACWCQK_39315 [Streptomyces sp. NPDC002306]
MNPPEHRTSAPSDVAAAPPDASTVTLLPLEAETRFRWSTSLVANAGAGPNARLRVRPSLTMGHWHGNVDTAARVADKLVDNAVRHGGSLDDGCVVLRLSVLAETGELLIEADDGLPGFPGFEDVADQSAEPKGTPKGLRWVAHYGGRLSWDVLLSADDVVVGKTVQAILPATGEVPA